jgi:hypothetical protein
MIAVDDAEEIAQVCLLAGRPDRIAEFIGGRLTPGEVKARLAEAAAPPTPAASTTAPANSGSIFGGPTPGENARLAAALKTRMEQVYPKRAP